MLDGLSGVETVHPSDHLVNGAESHLRHDLPQFIGHEEEEIDNVLRLAREPLAKLRVLGSDAHRAGVEVALA